MDEATAQMIFDSGRFAPLDPQVRPGTSVDLEPVDLEWSGRTNIGNLVEPGRSFSVDVIATLGPLFHGMRRWEKEQVCAANRMNIWECMPGKAGERAGGHPDYGC